MDISSLTNAAQSASSNAEQAKQQAEQKLQMGKEDFLKLLMTQIKSQDPMNPMKGQEFAAQLAQFSSVEQLLNINKTLGNQSTSNGLLAERINSSIAAGFLGKDVQARGTAIQWTGNGEVPLSFDLAGPASDVTVKITDAAGQTVFEQDMGSLSGGFHEFAWDGANADGDEVPRGNYSFSIEAADSNGNAVNTTPYLSGTVDRVTFGSDGPMLWVNGNQIPLNQVRSITDQ